MEPASEPEYIYQRYSVEGPIGLCYFIRDAQTGRGVCNPSGAVKQYMSIRTALRDCKRMNSQEAT